MLPQLTRLGRTALDLLFPLWCLGCGQEGGLICPSCRDKLPGIVPPICPCCGTSRPDATICPACSGQPRRIDGIRSPFRFEAVIRRAIHELKYKNLRAAARPLAELLGRYLEDNPLPAEALVPVPLHPKRMRERGYNQSELLCRELGRLTGLPVVADCLARKRHSPPQARTATVGQRRSNVVDAFSCRDQSLKGKKVLLIDDVATSGATLDACATALKASGAGSVWGLIVAREI